MNEQTRTDREPYYRTRSTLMIPESYFKRFFWRSPYIKVEDWYSMCYIFVYLMLVAMGVISLENGGTQPVRVSGHWNPIIICSVSVDAITRNLTRILQT